MRTFAHLGSRHFEISIASERGRLVLHVDGRRCEVSLDDRPSPIRSAYVDGRLVEFGWSRSDGTYRIRIDGAEYEVILRDPGSESVAKAARSGAAPARVEVRAPIPGLVKRVLLREGEPVRRNQAVLHVDAMKLENEIASPRDGTMGPLSVREGQTVEKGQLLFVVG